MNRSLRWRLLCLVLVLAVLVALAVAWSASPLRQWLEGDRMVATLRQLGTSFGPLAAVLGFALASVLVVPLGFLTLVALVALGPWMGVLTTFSGAILGAMASYGLGHLLGNPVLQKLGGTRIDTVSRRLADRGLLAVVAVRIVPIAPFAIVNMVAGASHIRLRDLVLGTALGIAPGTVLMAFFMDPIVAAFRDPDLSTVAIVLGLLALVSAGGWAARRFLR